MSEQQGIELPPTGDAAFAALMDTLVDDGPADPSLGEGAAPADGLGAEAPGAEGAGVDLGVGDVSGQGAATGATDEPPAGDAGQPAGSAAPADTGGDSGAEGAADAGPGGGDRAPAGAVDVATIATDLGGLSQKFEMTTTQAFQQQALEDVRGEHKQYFEALQKHPRLLVGIQVPSLNSDDPDAMETLRDANDAKDWQEAVKTLLTAEVRDRAEKAMEENGDIISTVHASIELFTKNKDLVPGTKQFNKQLADRFAAMAKPYELRVEGKLHGYTIPVQPLIDQLRTQIASERKSAPAAAAPAAKPKPKPDPPQAGIKSKAGSGAEADDFSTLFGTLGLPDLSR